MTQPGNLDDGKRTPFTPEGDAIDWPRALIWARRHANSRSEAKANAARALLWLFEQDRSRMLHREY